MSELTAKATRRRAAATRNGGKPTTLPPAPAELEAATGQDAEATTEQGAQQITLPPGVPCVVVLRIPTDQPGQENIQIAELAPPNNMDPLAIPTALRLAAQIKEKQLGIGKDS